jgi:hypothetical protein
MPNETVLKEELAFYLVLGQVYVGCSQLLQANALISWNMYDQEFE